MHNLPSHLGGHKNRTHLDEGVLSFMIKEFNIKSLIDIGCGPGGMVNLAEEMNLKTLGIDGDFTIKRKGENFLIHDYTLGPTKLNSKFDMAWSCEFVEHVHEEYIDNYIKDFQLAKYIVMTFSEKQGHHHVNINNEEYWIKTFENYDFKYDKDYTQKIRSVSTMNAIGKFAGKKEFVKTNGLFFSKF